jgi:hypothetical protein
MAQERPVLPIHSMMNRNRGHVSGVLRLAGVDIDEFYRYV